MSLAASPAASPSKALHVALWVGQVILAAMFLMAGSMKLLNAAELPFPLALALFIGTSEVLGAVGVLLPGLLRIKPGLVPLAASGLATIMVLATSLHFTRDEPVATTAVLGVIAIFVAWGRARKAPIAPR